MLHLEKLLIYLETFLVNIKNQTLRLIAIGIILSTTISCHTHLVLSKENVSQRKIDSTIISDEAITAYYLPYKKSLDSSMNAILVYSNEELTKAQPESKLSNFFSDAISATCKQRKIAFDFALPTTNGGIRTSLPKGAITLRNAFELMPFENELVVLYLPGTSITKLAQFIIEKGGQPVSNFILEVKGDSISTLLINNQPLELTKTYRVLTSDYLANGGDGIIAFKDAIKKENTNIKVRDAIIEYMRNEQSAGRTLNPMLDGRIKIEK